VFSSYQYFLNLDNINLSEYLLQAIVMYNIGQLFFCLNFFYLLAYFINLNIYMGLYLIIYDLDIFALILWLIYGGVVIIFFIYSLLWVETENINFFKKIFKNLFYIYLVFLSLFYFITLELFPVTQVRFFSNFFLNYYSTLLFDIYEELDNLGFLLIYLGTAYFIIMSYILLFACCVVIVIISNAKKLKYIQYYQENISEFNAHISKTLIKYQNYIFQDLSIVKNSKKFIGILINYSKIKNSFRRV
jgi:hypothetical protein